MDLMLIFSEDFFLICSRNDLFCLSRFANLWVSLIRRYVSRLHFILNGNLESSPSVQSDQYVACEVSKVFEHQQ